jgi:cyanophycin synthetase
VVGDGRRSIRALAEEINRDPNRSKVNPSSSLAPLPLEALTEAYLARTGRTLESVPAEGEIVFLRATANISTGGTAIDRTDEIHPVNRALCELAAGAVGLDVAGLDVLTPDISVPFRENGAVIIEVNASPGIRMHTHPDNGIPRDVPGAILDMIYPPGAETTIPVIAVTGSTGRTAATHLIAHLFRHAGRAVGSASARGVFFRELQLLDGDQATPFGANVVLSHPDAEVAVLETGHAAIVGTGLGFDQCDVGVVLDVHESDVGTAGVETIEQLADVKAVVPAVVMPSGHAVLNADDPRVLTMRTRTPGQVALFTARPLGENTVVTAHVANGGLVALVEQHAAGDRIVVRHRETHLPIVALRELPVLGDNGTLPSVLAAVLVAHAQGMAPELIRAALVAWVPDPIAS